MQGPFFRIAAMSHSVLMLRLFADAGVPMIAVTFPGMLMLLLPIICVEGLLYRKWISVTTWEAFKSSAISNGLSTLIGIPVAWAIMLGLEFGTFAIVDRSGTIQNLRSPIANVIFLFLGSAWIGPPSERTAWWIPAAVLVLLVPFFFASYLIESLVVIYRIGMPGGEPPNLACSHIRTAVRNANLVTYGAIFVGVTVWLLLVLPRS
jgi:hypothetical protein